MAETAKYHDIKTREGQSSEEEEFRFTFEGVRTTKRKWLVLSLIGILLSIVLIVSITISLKSQPEPRDDSHKATVFQHAAVATDAELCSMVGSDILRRNGSSVDGAVAVLFCLGVVNLHSCGIGGGAFVLVYIRQLKKYVAIDFREEAPLYSHEMMYENTTLSSSVGGSSVAVPGEVKGIWEIHQRFGKLPWQDLLQPAIDIAEKGFPISKTIVSAIERAKSVAKKNPSFDMSGLRNLLSDGKGGFKKEGDILKNPRLALTLRNIQKNGTKDFYEGHLAQRIVKDIKNSGGNITMQDLKKYKVKDREVLKLKLPGNLTLGTMSAPSGGPIVALILNILSGFDFSDTDMAKNADVIGFYQKVVESMKFAFAQRGFLGDPDFLPKKNISKVLEKALNRKYGDVIRSKIALRQTFNPSHYGGSWATEDHGTSHLSILAPNGDAVAATATVNLLFGSKVYSSDTGILYNNEMDDFSSPGFYNAFKYPPTPANFITPGKRPLSSMSPTIVTDSNGDVKMVCGASGGSKIITATAQALVKKLLLGMELGEAVESFRFHHQGVPNEILYHKYHPFRPPPYVLQAMRDIGHKLRETISFGVVQAIYKEADKVHAKSDPRKGGKEHGF